MIPTFLCLRRPATLLAALSLAFCALAGAVRADDAIPTFKDADVNAFVKAYGEFADQYAVGMKAYMADVKSNNTTKMQEDAKQMQANAAKAADLQTKSAAISGQPGKLKPEETQKFTAYVQKCAQKMADAAKPQ